MVWKDIPSTEGYQASECGQIRRTGGLPLKQMRNMHGYSTLSVKVDGKFKSRLVHRLVAEAHIGPQPSPKHVVAHKDGVRTNNHVSNLRWDTRAGNQRDRIIHGTHLRGGRSPLAKFTDEQARRIRVLLEREKATRSELAHAFGVSYETIRAIEARKTYRFI